MPVSQPALVQVCNREPYGSSVNKGRKIPAGRWLPSHVEGNSELLQSGESWSIPPRRRIDGNGPFPETPWRRHSKRYRHVSSLEASKSRALSGSLLRES